jgi:hypothetical protein
VVPRAQRRGLGSQATGGSVRQRVERHLSAKAGELVGRPCPPDSAVVAAVELGILLEPLVVATVSGLRYHHANSVEDARRVHAEPGAPTGVADPERRTRGVVGRRRHRVTIRAGRLRQRAGMSLDGGGQSRNRRGSAVGCSSGGSGPASPALPAADGRVRVPGAGTETVSLEATHPSRDANVARFWRISVCHPSHSERSKSSRNCLSAAAAKSSTDRASRVTSSA